MAFFPSMLSSSTHCRSSNTFLKALQSGETRVLTPANLRDLSVRGRKRTPRRLASGYRRFSGGLPAWSPKSECLRWGTHQAWSNPRGCDQSKCNISEEPLLVGRPSVLRNSSPPAPSLQPCDFPLAPLLFPQQLRLLFDNGVKDKKRKSTTAGLPTGSELKPAWRTDEANPLCAHRVSAFSQKLHPEATLFARHVNHRRWSHEKTNMPERDVCLHKRLQKASPKRSLNDKKSASTTAVTRRMTAWGGCGLQFRTGSTASPDKRRSGFEARGRNRNDRLMWAARSKPEPDHDHPSAPSGGF